LSAWIVSKKHIDYVVTAAIAAELIPGSMADTTGRVLWGENVRSVAYRYSNHDHTAEAAEVAEYTWAETPVLTGGALAKTLGCLNYQSCERPDWETTEASKLIERLRPAGDPPYDDDVPWGWD
jgi:xylose isomerase